MLYISYNGLGEPLVHSQVLPYLAGLAAAGHTMFLLSFERPNAGARYDEQQRRAVHKLQAAGIEWQGLTYHRTPTLPATAYDVANGLVRAARLIRRHGIEAVHARSYVPAVVAWWAGRLVGTRFVFDMRGLMADENVDAGHWPSGGWLYRMTKWTERRLIGAADEIVVLTRRVKDHLVRTFGEIPDLGERTTVIPCCVDDQLFAPTAPRSSRDRDPSALRLVYTGSVGTWYLLHEMLDFFLAGSAIAPRASFLWLNQNEHALIHAAAAARAVPPEALTVMAVRPDEMPARLQSADAGISFIKPTFSKSASSPTKFAEYLAMGLPVVTNAGVGDLDAIVKSRRVGVVVDDLSAAGYRRAWDELVELLRDPDLAARCRQVVEEEFAVRVGVARYRAVYARVERG